MKLQGPPWTQSRARWLVHLPALLLACSHSLASPDDRRADSTLFGFTVNALGDLDCDGVDDFAVGAPFASTDNGRSGTVLVLSGRSFEVLQRFDGSEAGACFGWSMVALGDLNADLATDLAIGSRLVSPRDGAVIADWKREAFAFGRIEDRDADGRKDLLILHRDKDFKEWFEVHSAATLASIEPSAIERLGRLRLVGDFDRDGWVDYATYGSAPPCHVSVRSGRDAASIRMFPSRASGWGASADDFNCIAGDFNGDGQPDLLFNASGFPRAESGRISACSGLDGAELFGLEMKNSKIGLT